MNNSKAMTSQLNKLSKPVDFQRFEQAMKRIVKVSKEELKRREAKVKNGK